MLTSPTSIPNNGSEVPYTAPTILLPSGEYIPDSRAIATALEAAHPSPTVHLDSPFLPRLEALMRRVLRPMYPIFIPRVPKVLLSPASLPYWMETREGWFGPLDELEKGADKGWVEMGEPLKEVTAMLREDGTGPLFMGKEVSYADFVWGGFLLFCQKLGDDVWERVLEGSGDAGVHRRFLEALRPWAREDL